MKKKLFWLIAGLIVVLSISLIFISSEVVFGVDEKFTLRDFNFRTTEGKIQALSQIPSDYIYIECWATWCPNCLKEHQLLNNQKRLFNNTSLVSISLDKDSFHTEKAISTHLFKFYYSVSDTTEWNSQYVHQFKFEDLPFNLLLNKERVIIGRNIDLEKLIELTGNH